MPPSDRPIIQAIGHCNKASDLLYGVQSIASALCQLGIPAGEDLLGLVNAIDAEVREANRCIGQSINDDFQRTQQATNNMVSAALSANLVSRRAHN